MKKRKINVNVIQMYTINSIEIELSWDINFRMDTQSESSRYIISTTTGL